MPNNRPSLFVTLLRALADWATQRRNEAHEAQHPEMKHGGDRKSDQVDNLSTRSFAADVAEKTGSDRKSSRQVGDLIGEGASKNSRAERRRRARQRVKDRAILADFFQERAVAFAGQSDALHHLVAELNADRERLRQQIALHHACMDDLGRRNAYLLDVCASAQHEAEHWKRFVDDERSREAEIMRKLQLN